MYKTNFIENTTIRVNDSVEGETIEEKVDRIVNNGEPIEDGAPIVFTERKDGVQPEFNIRTDRFDLAIGAMDKIAASKIAKREEGIISREEALKSLKKTEDKDGETESTVAPKE